MSNIIDKGVGRVGREQWSGERLTPELEQQVVGFYIGMVMDDSDDLSMGRLWVYIPSYSASRSDAQSLPTGREAPPKTQRASRAGWILCWPMLPFFGSDSYREKPDGNRNPGQGESNSYGFFYQPRIGDWVGILFANGDPARPYYVGCIPKIYENFMVPGNPNGHITVNGQNVDGPAMEKDEYAKDARRKPSVIFYNALVESGLLGDPLRGAGTSGIRRESPSRVLGLKSAGDPDTQMMGHQIVMDDLPTNQGLRLRTSKGNQVYLNDSQDFIYVSTSRGNVWMEFDDAGHVHVFSEDSISFHSRKDINLIADGNFNLDVKGNLNWMVGGTSDIQLKSDTNLRVGDTSGDFKIQTKKFSVSASEDVLVTATGNVNLKGAQIREQASGDFGVTVGGNYFEQAGNIFMNTSPGPAADPALAVGNPTLYTVDGPPNTTPPTGAGPKAQYAAPIVPQHEPWAVHTTTLPGLVGVVEEDAAYAATLRRGSSVPNATAPNSFSGRPTPTSTPGKYKGRAYSGDSLGEEPQYDFVGPEDNFLDPGNVALSQDGLDQIKDFEGFRSCPYPDAGKTSIGYGHQIQPGDNITGCISKDQAEALLMADTQKFQNCVNNAITTPLTQEQFDSMVSLAYNVGCSGFRNSQMVKSFNAGDTPGAIREWMGFVKSQGQVNPVLVQRRQTEIQNWATPASETS